MVLLSWSSGKDAALAFLELQSQGIIVSGLFTSVQKTLGRVSMHGVPIELVQAQANAMGLPLFVIELTDNIDMPTYNELMRSKLEELLTKGYTTMAFGDIHLEDLKSFRETQSASIGLKTLFPIYGRSVESIANSILKNSIEAIVICQDKWKITETICGKHYSEQLISELPNGIDICGENGEFHTFVYKAPFFKYPIPYVLGELVEKKYPAPKSDSDCFTDVKAEEAVFLFQDINLN